MVLVDWYRSADEWGRRSVHRGMVCLLCEGVDKWYADWKAPIPARASLESVRAVITEERQNLSEAVKFLCDNATDPTAAAFWRSMVLAHADILDKASHYLVFAWQRPVARRAVAVGAPGDETARLADR